VPFVLLWLHAFALTLAIELAVAYRPLAPAERGRLRRLAAIALANLASHPAVWFVFPELAPGHPDATLALSEAWAVASELLIYRLIFPRLSWRRAAVIAALANAASFAIGWALRARGH
jgi:hypothetical protein